MNSWLGVHKYGMKTFDRFLRDQIAQRQFVQDEGLPLVVLDLPARDQQLIAAFRTLVLRRLGLLEFLTLDARLNGHPIQKYHGFPTASTPKFIIVNHVVQRLDRLAVEFGRSVGDPDFPRRIAAVFKRAAAALSWPRRDQPCQSAVVGLASAPSGPARVLATRRTQKCAGCSNGR